MLRADVSKYRPEVYKREKSKILKKIHKVALGIKKKSLIGLQDSYQDRLALFNVHMYDEFHVPDVLIVLLYMWS